MNIESQLKRLGLSDKEVKVYLTLLELGSSPAQRIARKANVVRATTYVALNTLIERGLVERLQVGPRTAFSAQSPEQLLKYIEHEEKALHDMHEEISEIIPQLQAITQKMNDQPWVEYYQGVQGLRTMRQKMIMQSSFQHLWRTFTPIDYLYAVFGDRNEALYFRQRRAKGIRSQVIFTTASAETAHRLLTEAPQHFVERRFIPPERFPGDSGLTIYGSRLAIGKFSGEVSGIIINCASIATMMSNFFDLLWTSLPPQHAPVVAPPLTVPAADEVSSIAQARSSG